MGHQERPAAARLSAESKSRPSDAATRQRQVPRGQQGAHAAPPDARGTPPRGPFALRNWPVAWRLFAVIALAVAMGLVLGGLQIAAAMRQANQFTRVTTLARLGQAGIVLAQALEDERAATATDLSHDNGPDLSMPQHLSHFYGPVASGGVNSPDGGVTGAAAVRFEALAASVDASYPATTRARVAAVEQDVIAFLPALREEVQATAAGAPGGGQLTAVDDYSLAIAEIFQLNDVIAQGSGDSELTNDVQSLGALSRAKDQVSQQRAVLLAALTSFSLYPAAYAGRTSTADIQQLNQAITTSRTQQTSYIGSFEVSATSAQTMQLQTTAFLQPNATMQVIEDYVTDQQSLDLSQLGYMTVAPAQWDQVSGAAVAEYGQVESQLAQAIVDRSEALQQNAERTAWETAVLTGAVLVLVLLAALLVARSLVLPLRRLRAGALEIAAVSLPERVKAIGEGSDADPAALTVTPISVPTTDEIGQVARAFDLVHQEAVRLAGNEAMLRGNLNAMFVSLSRRSQSLIERLSRMIDALELSEDDPERLANLFAMDHLITRMRRNSENLLVLAGYEAARKRTESVLLADVARAATSEIEQYDRVMLNVQPGIEVSGQAATDVVHLLAEIIENATLYSPRTTEVRVTGQELASGGVLIEVTDSGVGISESRLEELNWRLEHPPVIDVAASRHMGLFAVAHLAARHGIRVRLRSSSPRGMAAMVWLPAAVATPSDAHYGDRLRRLGGRPLDAWQVPGQERARLAAGGRVPAASGNGRPSDGYATPAYDSGAYTTLSPQVQPPARESGQRPLPARAPSARAVPEVLMTGQETVQPTTARPSSNWFRTRQAEYGQDPRQGGWRDAGGPVPPGWAAPQSASSGMTTAGLPTRVPQASRASSDRQSGSWDMAPDALTSPLSSPYATEPSPTVSLRTVSSGPMQSPATPRTPSLPQRSPEAARSRLAGFQRGSRRAEGQVPRAGEGAER